MVLTIAAILTDENAPALIAAIVAIAALAVNTWFAASHGRSDVQRKLLEPDLADLAEQIHQVVACSFEQQKALVNSKAASAANWRERGERASRSLDLHRRRLRYPLDGLDEGLKNLKSVPMWTGHFTGSTDADTMLKEADQLAQNLHKAIARCWKKGKTPSRLHVRKVQSCVTSLRNANGLDRG